MRLLGALLIIIGIFIIADKEIKTNLSKKSVHMQAMKPAHHNWIAYAGGGLLIASGVGLFVLRSRFSGTEYSSN